MTAGDPLWQKAQRELDKLVELSSPPFKELDAEWKSIEHFFFTHLAPRAADLQHAQWCLKFVKAAALYLAYKNPPSRVTWHEVATRAAHTVGDWHEEMDHQRMLGGFLQAQQPPDLAKATRWFEDALRIAERNSVTTADAEILLDLGYICYQQGRYSDAESRFQRSLTILRKRKQRVASGNDLVLFQMLECKGLARLALTQANGGAPERAVQITCEETSRLFVDTQGRQRSVADSELSRQWAGEEYLVLSNLGMALSHVLPHDDRGEQWLKEAEVLGDRLGISYYKANVWCALHRLYLRRGDRCAADEMRVNVESMVSSLKDPRAQANVLLDLGRSYFHDGDFEKGLDLAKQALALVTTGKDEEMQAHALGSILNNLFQMASHDLDESDSRAEGQLLERMRTLMRTQDIKGYVASARNLSAGKSGVYYDALRGLAETWQHALAHLG
ncbi:MAG: tetratricopeptide repeat protein [Planctomycetes bacterium]|nr:tetratricopeptide repeat protein [Planctomycetota bacterium]